MFPSIAPALSVPFCCRGWQLSLEPRERLETAYRETDEERRNCVLPKRNERARSERYSNDSNDSNDPNDPNDSNVSNDPTGP